MRLIDVDALRERMYHDAFEIDSDMQKWDGGCWIRYKMFEKAIEETPTIEPDVIPVDWIQEYADDWLDIGYAYENPIQGMLDDWRDEQDE